MAKKVLISVIFCSILSACASHDVSVSQSAYATDAGNCGARCSQAFILGTHKPQKAAEETCGPNCSQALLLGTKKPASEAR